MALHRNWSVIDFDLLVQTDAIAAAYSHSLVRGMR